VDWTGEGLVGCRHDRTFADHQHALLDQGPRDRRSGAGEDAGEGRPGNSHSFGRSLLVEPLEVGQAKGLELVEPQRFDLEGADGAADGLERPSPGHATDPPELFRSCHVVSQLRTYVHN
jgi:hypothetical protein